MMKRENLFLKLQWVLGVLLFGIFLFPGFVRAETIHNFSSAVIVDAQGKLVVTETIQYDFGVLSRHGIFRTIPYSYVNPSGTRVSVNLVVQSVKDDAGAAYPFSVSRSGGSMEIKIGDPDTLITGEHTYVITYTADRVLRWYDGEPELYWNVTGNEWDVEIEQASFVLGGAVFVTPEKLRCYTGETESTETACLVEPGRETGSVRVTPLTAISSGEGLTIAARFPAGSIPEPSGTTKTLWFLQDNWGFALPVLALIILILLFRRYGKDPKGRGTIIAEYEAPKNMSPALLGYLIDERIDPRDITASILQLAVKGHLRIEHVERKLQKDTYRLIKKKDPAKDLTEFERSLFDALFSAGDDVQLTDLQKTLPRELSAIKKHLHDEAKERGYYTTSPHILKALFFVIAGACIWGGASILGFNLSVGLGLIISGGIAAIFAPFMSQRTPTGVLAIEHIKGFKEFLTVTEKDRLKFHNAPKVRPEQFMAFLPFAVALAVEKEWAKQFEHIAIPQPDWYTGNWGTFNAMIFASSIGDFRSATSAQAMTSPASRGSGFNGGGGFSGGGFGGGGGGSW